MIRRTLLICIVVSGLLLSLIGLAQAQESGPQGAEGIQAVLGTAFTYQGQLKNGGTGVTGSCEMAFRLFDAATLGGQVGAPITQTVAVNVGLFTTQLDFGASAFNGQARWLEIAVKCASDAGFTTLSRQALTPAPHALALPGLYTRQNATSPNIIGGYSGNSISSVVGSVIGGGGSSGQENRVQADYATVGGGRKNTTNAYHAAISGGYSNTVNSAGMYAMVGGGGENVAGGPYNVIGGGWGNITSYEWHSTIGGGWLNNSTHFATTIGGGRQNTASNRYATIGGGEHISVTGHAATVAGGSWITATGNYAAVGGGSNNTASGDNSTVPGGSGAAAIQYGQMAYASGDFANPGDAQASLYVMRRTTPDNTNNYPLYLDGSGDRLNIADGHTVAFEVLVVGRTEAGESAGYHIQGVVENIGGTTAFLGGLPTVTILGEDDANWNAYATVNSDFLDIAVKGNGEIIRWVATVRTSEVAW
ncbi:hypothetical protein TFLX_02517 [Thermoflexales bacterium]|nr:hypothetical protein TFLX_02517 [Thermoflexales bacterium]